MKPSRRAIPLSDLEDFLWIEGDSNHPDSKILLTITDAHGERTALITPDEIQSSKAILFVSAPEERVAIKGKRVTVRAFEIARLLGYLLTAVVLTFSAFSYAGVVKARIVLTGSMQPAIDPGDIIITTPTSNKTPEVGDIVAYTARRFNGGEVGIFSHRIIGGDATSGFIVKGDKNTSPDVQRPTMEDITGVVIAIIPFIGNFLTPRALFLIVPTIIGLWLIMDAMKHAE